MKQTVIPDHEFLVVDTVDNADQCHRKFVLHRMTSKNGTIVAEDDDEECLLDKAKRFATALDCRFTLIDKTKRFATALAKLWQSPDPPHTPPSESMETSSSLSSLSIEIDTLSVIDKSTISLTQSADLISDSLDKIDYTPAYDYFEGQNTMRKKNYAEAETVRIIRPKNLKLFQLVVLAHVVHKLHPRYALLRQQCFFFASVIVFTIEERFGVLPAQTAEDHNVTDFTKSGRWQGFKIQVIDKGVINRVVEAFDEFYPQKLGQVCSFFGQSLTY
jgi:hypothetical protein